MIVFVGEFDGLFLEGDVGTCGEALLIEGLLDGGFQLQAEVVQGVFCRIVGVLDGVHDNELLGPVHDGDGHGLALALQIAEVHTGGVALVHIALVDHGLGGPVGGLTDKGDDQVAGLCGNGRHANG